LGYNPAAHWGAHTLGDLFKRERQRETERNREAERERERERDGYSPNVEMRNALALSPLSF
jgi:hypothetical protein